MIDVSPTMAAHEWVCCFTSGCIGGAISAAISASVQVRGHLLVKQAVNSPQKHILRIFKIDLVTADLSIELLGVEFIV